jgi:hypothetical protein
LHDSRNSLQAADAAATLASAELGARYNPAFEYADIEGRWLKYSRTNHLFNMPASVPKSVVYDIIPPSFTNRVMILKDYGETKLVLFKLEYPPVPASVDAMYLKYSCNSLTKLLLVRTNYLNAVWGYFNDWADNDMKCEFRYEWDTSKTNVQAISVTTNSVIFDGYFTLSTQ